MGARFVSLIVLVVVLIAIPAPAPAFTAKGVGVVTQLQGQAAVQHAGAAAPEPLRFRGDVFWQDVITTQRASLARLLLLGSSIVTVRELTRFELVETTLPRGRLATLTLRSGGARVSTAPALLRPDDRLEFRTPNAVASIRGTDVVVEVGEEAGEPVTDVYVLAGEAEVRAEKLTAWDPTRPPEPILLASAGPVQLAAADPVVPAGNWLRLPGFDLARAVIRGLTPDERRAVERRTTPTGVAVRGAPANEKHFDRAGDEPLTAPPTRGPGFGPPVPLGPQTDINPTSEVSGRTLEESLLPPAPTPTAPSAATAAPPAPVLRFDPELGFAVPTAGSQPRGIARDPSGNIYFTEFAANKIGKLTPGGTITETLLPSSPFVATSPRAIVSDSSGNVFFLADVASVGLVKMTPGGIFSNILPGCVESFECNFLAADNLGNVFLLKDGGEGETVIGKRLSDGSLTEIAGGTDFFDATGRITTDASNNVFITRTGPNRIARVTPSDVVTNFAVDLAGGAFGGASFGHVLTTDPSGRIIFPLAACCKIARFDPATGSLTFFTTPSALGTPLLVGTDSSGNIYFATAAGFGKITPDGTIVTLLLTSAFVGITDVVVSPSGDLFFTDQPGNKIGKVVDPPVTMVLYVDGVTGDDGGLGSQAQPLKTIVEALNRAAAGTLVQVAAGSYGLTSPLTLRSEVTVAGAGPGGTTLTGGGGLPSLFAGGPGLKDFQVQGLRLEGWTDAAFSLSSGSGAIFDTTLAGSAGTTGIRWDTGGTYTIVGNTISAPQGTGVTWQGDSSPALRNNTIAAPGGTAVTWGSGGAPVLTGNTISASTGIAWSGTSSPVVQDNQITAEVVGISGGGPATLANNVLKAATAGAGLGLNLLAGDPIVRSNLLSGWGTGIQVLGGSPLLQGNTIMGNLIGIDIRGGSPDLGGGARGSLGGNLIQNNTITGIRIAPNLGAISALHNTFNPNVQGTSAAGKFADIQTITGPTSGPNFTIGAGSALRVGP